MPNSLGESTTPRAHHASIRQQTLAGYTGYDRLRGDSRKDKKAFDVLVANLAALENEGHRVWTDQEIAPGQQWHDEITRALARTRVAVLLVIQSMGIDYPDIS